MNSTAVLTFLIIAYFLTASITTYDIRMIQARRDDSEVPLLPNWIGLFGLLQWAIFLVLLYMNWRLAILLFVAKFVLKVLPVLETVGYLLLLPYITYFPARQRAISQAELDEHDKLVNLDRLKNERFDSSERLERKIAKATPADPEFEETIFDELAEFDIKEDTSEKFERDALVSWRKGDHKKALALYSEAISLNPLSGVAFLNRGNLQVEIGQFEAGINDLERAHEIDPDLPWQNAILLKALSDEAREELRRRRTGPGLSSL